MYPKPRFCVPLLPLIPDHITMRRSFRTIIAISLQFCHKLLYKFITKNYNFFHHQEFVLHMDDQISGHGFLPVYTGSDTSHISTGLRRNASYKFRLQAQNEEGKSPWSDEVSYYTLPDVPGPPLRPASKGRLHPHSFKVKQLIFVYFFKV